MCTQEHLDTLVAWLKKGKCWCLNIGEIGIIKGLDWKPFVEGYIPVTSSDIYVRLCLSRTLCLSTVPRTSSTVTHSERCSAFPNDFVACVEDGIFVGRLKETNVTHLYVSDRQLGDKKKACLDMLRVNRITHRGHLFEHDVIDACKRMW